MDNYHVECYKVRFKHYRYSRSLDGVVDFVKRGLIPAHTANSYVKSNDAERPQPVPSLHGGKTECYIIDPMTNAVISDGVALCSWKDCFNRKIGRAISFGRAVKRLQEMQNMEVDCAETRTTA